MEFTAETAELAEVELKEGLDKLTSRIIGAAVRFPD
jgi:hypothetical protein